jgi:hypothetical protein
MITSAPGDAVDDALARALGMPVTPLGPTGYRPRRVRDTLF